MKKINIALDWFANTNHAGFYVALDKGFFKEAGLEAVFRGDVHGVMDAGSADIVVAPEPSLLCGMDRGDRLSAVAVLTQVNDSGILSLKEAGIERPRNLARKRLTHWTPQWFHSVLSKAVSNDGGDYGDVILVQKDVGDIEATLGCDADATWIYRNWEYFVMKQAGKDVNYFAFADLNPLFDFCAPAVAASHRLIDGDPDTLRAFLACAGRGYAHAANNPDAAAQTLMKYMGASIGARSGGTKAGRGMEAGNDAEAGRGTKADVGAETGGGTKAGNGTGKDGSRAPSLALVQESMRYVSRLFLDEAGRWGAIKPARWDAFADWMVAEGLISQRRDNERTNEFLAG